MKTEILEFKDVGLSKMFRARKRWFRKSYNGNEGLLIDDKGSYVLKQNCFIHEYFSPTDLVAILVELKYNK